MDFFNSTVCRVPLLRCDSLRIVSVLACQVRFQLARCFLQIARGNNVVTVKQGPRLVDAVVVWCYDRFARSLRQLVNALCEFDWLGIQFISLHEGVDTSTPNGRLLFGTFASIAEFERKLIRERVRSGVAAARARGVRLGRPRSEVDAQKVAALRAQGASWREITVRLGVGSERFTEWRRDVPKMSRWLPPLSAETCAVILD